MITRPITQSITRPITEDMFGPGFGGGAAPAFSPASLFAGTEPGIWIDASDMSTGFQDSAGTTPQTATGQPTGRRTDKTGNGLHVTQATAGARPTYNLEGTVLTDTFDGFDDGYKTAVFAAGTLVNGMDCFLLIKRVGAVNVPLSSSNGAGNYFDIRSGVGGAAAQGAGSPSFAVNGVDVPGGTASTADQVFAALPASGNWAILEIRNGDFSAWTAFRISEYFSGFLVNGSIAETILCPVQSAGTRTQIRQYLAAKAGITL